MSKKKLVVWFDGNLLLSHAGTFADMTRQAASGAIYGRNFNSEQAEDFNDRMKFIEISNRYRGATRALFESQLTGRKYTMFVDDFSDLLNAKQYDNLIIHGTFRYIKKGTAQAIKLVLPAP